MHIVKVEANRWKVGQFIHELYPMCLVTGVNGAGKTAVLQAIQWVMTGALGEPVGKRPDRLWRMVFSSQTPGEASVILHFSDGSQAGLSLRNRDGRCSVSGKPLGIPAHILDPQLLHSMTVAQRTELMLSSYDLDFDTGLDRLMNEFRELGGNPDELEITIQPYTEKADGSFPMWLFQFAETAKANAKAAKQNAERHSAFLIGARQKTPPPPVNPAELENLKTALSKLPLIPREPPEPDKPSLDPGLERALKRLQDERKQIASLKECPYCGPDSARGWQENALRRYDAEIERLKDELDRISGKQVEEWAAKHKTWKREHDLWTKLANQTNQQRDELNRQIGALEQQLKERKRWEAEQAKVNEVEAELVKSQQSETFWGLVAKAALSLARQLTDEAGQRLQSRMEAFLRLVVNGTPILHDGQLALNRNGMIITADTMSESERVAVTTAFVCALSASGPMRLVLMDEMGLLTPAAQARLIANVRAMIQAGMIHQFIGALATDSPAVKIIQP